MFDSRSSAASAPLTRPSAQPATAIPSVDWWITSRCNLACDFCYGPVPDLDPLALREEILTAIGNCTADTVTLCGGEPLLVRDIGLYAGRLTGSGKRTVLNTNGLLLRRRVDQGLELAFSVVGLSIDGSTGAVHSAMRGMKADLAEVLRAAELIAETPGTSLKLATVVSAVNRHDLPSLARLVRRLQPDVWRLYQYSVRGAWNVGQRRHLIPEAEFRHLAEEATALAAPVPTAPSSEELTAGCLIVDPEGNVLQPTGPSCAPRGNCLEEPIDAIWARMPGTDTITENKRWLSIVASKHLAPEVILGHEGAQAFRPGWPAGGRRWLCEGGDSRLRHQGSVDLVPKTSLNSQSPG